MNVCPDMIAFQHLFCLFARGYDFHGSVGIDFRQISDGLSGFFVKGGAVKNIGVMRIVFIRRMVGDNRRNPVLMRTHAGKHADAEFGLGVDNIQM